MYRHPCVPNLVLLWRFVLCEWIMLPALPLSLHVYRPPWPFAFCCRTKKVAKKAPQTKGLPAVPETILKRRKRRDEAKVSKAKAVLAVSICPYIVCTSCYCRDPIFIAWSWSCRSVPSALPPRKSSSSALRCTRGNICARSVMKSVWGGRPPRRVTTMSLLRPSLLSSSGSGGKYPALWEIY